MSFFARIEIQGKNPKDTRRLSGLLAAALNKTAFCNDILITLLDAHTKNAGSGNAHAFVTVHADFSNRHDPVLREVTRMIKDILQVDIFFQNLIGAVFSDETALP